VTGLEVLHACAVHVFESFARQNVVYLELRTTAKRFPIAASGASSGGLSSEDYSETSTDEYVETVLRAFEDFKARSNFHCASVTESHAAAPSSGRTERTEAPERTSADGAGPLSSSPAPMEVKLLLSIDRGRVKSVEDARAQVQEAKRLALKYADFVVGIDVCGNPLVPSVVPFVLPALREEAAFFHGLLPEAERGQGGAAAAGAGAGAANPAFPITFHCGEVADEAEVSAILDAVNELNIRRLGHCCFVGEENAARIVGRIAADDGGSRWNLGVEMCPTSNMVTTQDSSLANHHFPRFWKKVPCSICTDDSGLFRCDLSAELHQIAACFGLGANCLRQMQRDAVAMSFHRDKDSLLARLGGA